MPKLIQNRKIVLSAFHQMGGSPLQMIAEQIKTLSPGYVSSWLESIQN